MLSALIAVAGSLRGEDAALLKAVAVIQLLAGSGIGGAARGLQIQVSMAHSLPRQSGYEAARAKIDAADQSRLELFRLFEAGLRRQPAIAAAPRGGSQPAAPATPAPDLAG